MKCSLPVDVRKYTNVSARQQCVNEDQGRQQIT